MTRRTLVALALLASCALTMGAGWLSGPRFGPGNGPGFAPVAAVVAPAAGGIPDPYEKASLVIDARLWELQDPGVGQGPATLVEHGLSTTNYSQSLDTLKPTATTSLGLACAYFDNDYLESADTNNNDVSGAVTVAVYGLFPNYSYGGLGGCVSNATERTTSTKAGYNLYVDQPNNRVFITSGNSGAYNAGSSNVSTSQFSVVGYTLTGTGTLHFFKNTTDITAGYTTIPTFGAPEPCSYPVDIGKIYSTGWYLKGYLRRVCVWKKDLSANWEQVYAEMTRTDL